MAGGETGAVIGYQSKDAHQKTFYDLLGPMIINNLMRSSVFEVEGGQRVHPIFR